MRYKLSFVALTLLIISAIDSNRNLPSAAIFGSSLIFYFIFSAVFFLFPTALVSSELSAAHPERGGIYHWVTDAFGEKWGFLAIWLQWVNTVVWLPTILSFIAGSIAFLIDPALVNNKIYMISMIVGIFWGLTFLNLKGIHISANANSILALIGTLVPMCFLITLGALWFIKKEPINISFEPSAIFPKIGKLETWVALEAIMSSFTGMELAGVHIRDVKNPQKIFPRALGVATLIIVFTMLFGALMIAAVLPGKDINLAGGMMQVFDAFFKAFHLTPLIPTMTILIVLGTLGGVINWMISPSRGLLLAAEHRFMPPYFTKLNRHKVAHRILYAQAILVTFTCALLLLLPGINAFYWLLTALNTGLYMIMYILMFLAALKLRKTHPIKDHHFVVPGGKTGLWSISIMGIIGAALTIILGFVPPDVVNVGSGARYTFLITLGNVIFIAPVFLFFHYKKKHAQI